MEEYTRRWNEIGEFLGSQQWPESNYMKLMEQLLREATKHLIADGVLYPRRKTDEPPAMVLTSNEQTRNTIEAAYELSR